MKQMELKDIDQALGSIQKVEASNYLLTRVHQRIQHAKEEQVPPLGAWLMAATLSLVLCLNILAFSIAKQSDSGTQNPLNEMGLIDDNSLYN